jgi:hypothetical protein
MQLVVRYSRAYGIMARKWAQGPTHFRMEISSVGSGQVRLVCFMRSKVKYEVRYAETTIAYYFGSHDDLPIRTLL